MKEDVIKVLEEIRTEIDRDIENVNKLRNKVDEYEEYVFYSERKAGLELAKTKIWKRLLKLKRGEE